MSGHVSPGLSDGAEDVAAEELVRGLSARVHALEAELATARTRNDALESTLREIVLHGAPPEIALPVLGLGPLTNISMTKSPAGSTVDLPGNPPATNATGALTRNDVLYRMPPPEPPTGADDDDEDDDEEEPPTDDAEDEDQEGEGEGTGVRSRTPCTPTEIEDEEEESDGSSRHFPFEANIFAFCEDYIFIERLADNEDNVVYKAMHRQSKMLVAIKIVDQDVNKLDDPLPKEVKLLYKLQGNPNIQRLITWQALPKTKCWAMITEFVESEQIDGENKELMAIYVRDCIKALALCHSKGILYRDMKPANVLFDRARNRLVLIDFDCSTEFDPKNPPYKRIGTEGYIAPEIPPDNEDKSATYGFPVDMWSAGVTFMEVLFRDEFREKDIDTEAVERICLSLDNKEPLHNLLLRLLEKDPSRRITSQHALFHPYIAANMATQAVPPVVPRRPADE